MLTMPVFSKTSYSYLHNPYENSSFNFCVCLHRANFVVVVVRITWHLIFVLCLSSAVTGFYDINFPFPQSHKTFFHKLQNWWKKVLMNPLELHFCSNRHIPKVNLVNLNHCCMSHNYSELSQVHEHWNVDNNLLRAKFEVLTAVTVKIMDLDVWHQVLW